MNAMPDQPTQSNYSALEIAAFAATTRVKYRREA
jgi:hypothetical protein